MGAVNKLTAAAVKSREKRGRYGDGRGLWLQVSKWGTKSWLFRYMIEGRAREMGLGPVSLAKHDGGVTLAEARERRDALHRMLRDGIDPLEHRREQRDKRRAEQRAAVTFKEAAEQFFEVHEATWRNEKHRQTWRNSLAAYAYPKIGDRPVSAIDDALINEVVAPIWTTKAETAHRVKQRIARVIKWVSDGMPLPAVGKTRRVKHHPAMPYRDLPGFMERLRGNHSISARALEFTILTAARTGEVIGAEWPEIDLERKIWTVPGTRTKSGKVHRVPLPDRAVEILEALPREKNHPHVFIGARAGRGLSNMAMLELLRGMDDSGFTVHGFRAAFKTWVSEVTGYANIVSEAALAHTIADKVEASYRRGDLFDKRRRLMRDWATYCAAPAREPAEATVVGINAARAK